MVPTAIAKGKVRIAMSQAGASRGIWHGWFWAPPWRRGFSTTELPCHWQVLHNWTFL